LWNHSYHTLTWVTRSETEISITVLCLFSLSSFSVMKHCCCLHKTDIFNHPYCYFHMTYVGGIALLLALTFFIVTLLYSPG